MPFRIKKVKAPITEEKKNDIKIYTDNQREVKENSHIMKKTECDLQ